MEKHKIDELFSEKLTGLEQPVSAASWQQISGELKSKKRFPIGIWLSIAASAALLITSAYLLLEEGNSELEDIYITNTTNVNVEPGVAIIETQVPLFVKVVTELNDDELLLSANEEEVIVPNKSAIETPSATSTTVADNSQTTDTDLSPILDSEFSKVNPVMAATEEETPLFSDVDATEEEPVLLASNETLNEPIQIIYKQGEVEEQSKISKALSFMDDVRKGDKRLINLNKFKKGLFTKNKEEGPNSK
jgi:ribosomal protein L12E/L44/L45/RPP1/RPP2